MPTKYTGRLLTILVVVYIAVAAIYPRAPISVFKPLIDKPVSWEHNLRRGIDMAGGTSLIYEIEATDNAVTTSGLAEEVATALKRRVDPQGVRNLIWRPQGDTRLEIQMPLSGDSEAAAGIRDAYLAAQKALGEMNVAPQQVIRVVETMTGEERQTELERLAGGSERRRAVFAEVSAAYDAFKQAQAPDAFIGARDAAERAYVDAKAKIEQTNLNIDEVQLALAAKEPGVRTKRLEELARRNEGFPARTAALDRYIKGYDDFVRVQDEVADTASLKRLLQGSGVLEFGILADDVTSQAFEEYRQRLMTTGPRPRAEDKYRWYPVDRAEDFEERRPQQGRTPGPGSLVRAPDGADYLLSHAAEEKTMDDRDGDWGLQRATLTSDENGGGAVAFELDPLGGRLFGDLSGAHVRQPLAIVLDKRIISAPNLEQRIDGGSVRITRGGGGFGPAEIDYLVNTLNAGALPARLSSQPIVERTVGPQLGEDNLRAGLMACVFGLGVVALFLIGYYWIAGVVAFVAVLLNMVLILGSMAALNATFTLPGVAGIILSIGMAVDANVLIFERLREEQARGLSIRMALRNAYDRAFSAIFDSNITTGITALILYVFGSEEVAGFGLTLLIGIFASLFTALFVTRTIFGLLVDKFGLTDLWDVPRYFPRWNRLLTPKIDWMSKAPLFGMISAVIITIGCGLFAYFAVVKKQMLDIEFAGGTTAEFDLRAPARIEEIRAALDDQSGPLRAAQIVAIEPSAGQPSDTTYEVVVPNMDKQAVTDAIVQRLGDRLNMRPASTFANADATTLDAALGVSLFPIEADMTSVDGLAVDRDRLAANSGGVAIVLRDLSPILSREDLADRFNQQRLTGVYDAEGLRGGVRVDVETFDDGRAAVLLVSNERYLYAADPPEILAEWRRELAGPAWELVRDAVTNPDELQKVANISAQVAGEFQRDAAIAFVLSILVIMAYVWLRFGDLKFGGATVLALAHDTLFCIAAIGYAHLLAHTFVGDALLLDPFRMNLTMVAAILTVMGFSMNDTVVVFDRIRENRGKYGVLTRQVINDSINQTLSRTLLTGGTTIVTIFVMYAFGGPGIHGFTYAMLVGIVTGTYSSIAIASPVLLWGRRYDEAAPPAPATAGAPATALTASSA